MMLASDGDINKPAPGRSGRAYFIGVIIPKYEYNATACEQWAVVDS